jgi:prepilin-type N-terminal cleavage/methylation domain-containing protein
MRNRGFSLIELMIIVTITGVLTVMAIPALTSVLRNLRGAGDLQSIAGDVALAKMRAAANFTRARLRADLTARTFQVEVWNKTTNTWDVEGGVQNLSRNVNFGFGSLTTPPLNTQASLAQGAACTDGAGANIANTACILFNSRGIPVDWATTTPNGNGAIYVNDGNTVQGVTVAATGLSRTWRRDISASTSWMQR